MSYPDERQALWLTLDAVTGIGPVTASRLLELVGGSIDALFQCDEAQLHGMGLSSEQIKQLRWPSPLVEQSLVWAALPGNVLIPQDHPVYPSLLREIPAAPLLLYCRGDLAALSLPQLAKMVVSTPIYSGNE